MNIYDIADLKVGLNCHERTMMQAKKYLSATQDCICDLTLITNSDSVTAITERGEYITPFKTDINSYFAPHLCEGKSFYRKLISEFNGMMIHASAVVVDDKAYLFSAASGTGKSTHTGKWLELFGKRAYILNDDKPAVRVLDDGIYAYGTPWSGKYDISVNKKIKIQGICFLERGSENKIKPLIGKEAIIHMVHSSLRKLESYEISVLLNTIEKIIADVPIYLMECTPTLEAAKLSYSIMSK